MGGSDQWGNITTGTELIRRMDGGSAFAFTCPLLTKSDGGKFGKTEKGNIWLDSTKTSAYEFYQFWFNAADADAEKWIKIFTFLPKFEIDTLIETHATAASKRILQRKLAESLTLFVHGDAGLAEALATTEKLFAQQSAPAESLSIEDLENMQGVQRFQFEKRQFETGIDVISFLSDTNIFPSKGEARKMLQNGGVSINRKKVENMQQILDTTFLLHQKFMLVQKGKKQYYLVEAT